MKENTTPQSAARDAGRITPGQCVLTETTSGHPILCTVIKRDGLTGEWLLNSPEHGYAITRASSEIEEAH